MESIKRKFFIFQAKIKNKKDSLILPLVKLLISLNFAPLKITILSFVFGLFAALSLFFSKNLFLIFILLSWLFDILDGAVARYQKSQSDLGWWYDYSSDRIVMFLIILVTLFINPNQIYLILALLILYSFVNIFYLINNRNFVIIHHRTIYCILIYFSISFANIFSLTVNIINLILILFEFFYQNFYQKK